jgi:virginiamycin B lyase
MHLRKAFTLIELLVVIAIIAVLAVVVILTLNPAEMFRQARDSTRLSDMSTITGAVNFYTSQQGGSAGYFLGTSSITYISVPDPTATTTAGTNCAGLGLPVASTTYHCPASSTYRNVNGTGWIPVKFTSIDMGSPLSSLPVDPTNTTSSGEYYEYMTDGINWQVVSYAESQKYISQAASSSNAGAIASFSAGTTRDLITLNSTSSLSSTSCTVAFTTLPINTENPIFAITSDGTNMWTTNGSNGGPLGLGEPTSSGVATKYMVMTFWRSLFSVANADDGTTFSSVKNGADAVTKITPSGVTTDYFVGDGYFSAHSIAFDPYNNSIWTVSDNIITKITPSGATTEYSINDDNDNPVYPSAITSDGTNVWTANYINSDNNSTVTKITPSGTMTTYSLNKNDAQPAAIASDGTNVWVVNWDSTLIKLTPSGATTEYSINDDNGDPVYPVDIASDGTNMWMANNYNDTVTKITQSGVMTNYSLNDDNAQPEAIAFDPYTNSMWTANYNNTVTKITSSGATTEYSLNDDNAYPQAIAFDPYNNSIWVVNSDNTITEFIPSC